jgi:nucleoside-diphosphate-sugar epimerase
MNGSEWVATGRVLVTGATGFIGRHCLAALQGTGIEVHAVSSKDVAVDPRGTTRWHSANLLADSKALIEEVRPTHLLHLAWDVVPPYWQSPHNREWMEASLRLMEQFAAAGGSRVAVSGTCAEYGRSTGRCDERSTRVDPASLYGTCKSSLANSLNALASTSGMSVAWTRLFYPFGPGERRERLVPTVATALIQGRMANCTSGQLSRDFLYVKDVASALVAVLTSDATGPINIGSGTAIQIMDLVNRLAHRIGRPELVSFETAVSDEKQPLKVEAATERLNVEVGWKPQYTLDAALDETIEWWRARLLRSADASS